MPSNFRPEDWEEERDQWLNRVGGEFADSGEVMEASVIYEAGADAVLEGLCLPENLVDTEQKIKQAIASLPLIAKSQRGYLVFIPEEK